MSNADFDKALESFLSRRQSLPERLADLERPEPPEELDRIVLSRAREAIQVSRPTPVFTAVRWALPVGFTVVVLLLAFGAVLHMGLPTQTGDTAAVAQKIVRTTPVAPPPSIADAARTMPSAAPPPTAGGAPTTPSAPPLLVADVAQSAPVTPGELAAETETDIDEADLAEVMVTGHALRDTPALAPGNTSAGLSRRAERATAITSVTEITAEPDVWLQRIDALREQGETAEADRQWQKFREAYPQHPRVLEEQ